MEARNRQDPLPGTRGPAPAVERDRRQRFTRGAEVIRCARGKAAELGIERDFTEPIGIASFEV
jgi:hypothetical protein